jgi:hypothetical protein
MLFSTSNDQRRRLGDRDSLRLDIYKGSMQIGRAHKQILRHISISKRNMSNATLQHVPYCTQCAIAKGLHPSQARPATYDAFNEHPTMFCQMYHPQAIQWTVGCSVHRGPLNQQRQCIYCISGLPYPVTRLDQTTGYRQ